MTKTHCGCGVLINQENCYKSAAKVANPRLRAICKKCYSAKAAVYRDKNRDKLRIQYRIHYQKYKQTRVKQKLLSRYNLTIEEHQELMQWQEHRCLICGEKKTLVVDHDHTTGLFRGLLCRTCNTGIGHLKDSVDLLESAIRYLKYAQEARNKIQR